ncbi:SIMPL domain-containing protein [Pseudonocardia aurantiaca]|uniref:SIMPL domain-containing protein n=1 Tax=Pseudonocardia aurantiaca TaxID=75290 RepID=A0ABW4FEY0_9PSEU
MNRALSTALLAVGTLAATGCASAPATPAVPPEPTVTTRGVGIATGTPDLLTVTLGVQTRDRSAAAALDANNTRAAAVIDVLRAAGVAPADLQTSQLTVYPTYDQTGSRISGYEVSNMVTARLRDITAAGAVIDRAGEVAGDAVRVQQVGFSIDDDSPVRAAARADGVRRAIAQATQLAEAAGVRLGPIRSITERPAEQPGPLPYAADARVAAQAVPIEPGSQKLTVAVEVVHEIAR